MRTVGRQSARRFVAAALIAAALPTLATGCAVDYRDNGPRPRVVASTDVYGSVVRAIAANSVRLTTFITGAARDPHTFEADARDELAVARADVVVENGGGYDDFVGRLRAAVPSSATDPVVLNAVALSRRRVGPDFNEHVFYDLPTVIRLAHRLDGVLSRLRPADQARYARNTAAFVQGLRRLQHRETQLRATAAGTGVAITEPVPLYLLEACGLVNRTPRAFSTAVEDDTGISPNVLSRTLALFADHAVRALVYNAQTAGPETSRVLDAARAADIPAVPVTETLPAGEGYVAWLSHTLTRLAAALART